MDDGLVLNLDVNASGPVKTKTGKKGGRWTDRLKAKRGAKRKAVTEQHDRPSKVDHLSSGSIEQRPVKRPRTDAQPSSATARGSQAARPTHFISSLFSSNPKVETPTSQPAEKINVVPSNAPLEASTFTGLGLNSLIVAHLTEKLKIAKPTSIQRSSIPALISPASSERDVFIQSQTGSGKTLAFLLPIIHDLLPLGSLSYIDRSIGTLAIIVTPTRELAKQISDVLESLLQLRLRPQDDSADESISHSTRLTRWMVSGLLIGGATRTHEKARLRKGIPILVSTPGRLLDHLQNTSSFNVGKCRWLVLDEADRLMELGFEETISGILKGLDGRRKLAIQAVKEGRSMEVGGWDWDRRRKTILCSATIREDVQKLAGTALQNPLVTKATEAEPVSNNLNSTYETEPSLEVSHKFTPPSQLSQKYVIVPLKLRLVALVAILRSILSQSRRGSKIIVFFSCTDSVDFHWNLLGGMTMGSYDESADHAKGNTDGSDDSGAEEGPAADANHEKVALECPLLPNGVIYRLHGSLPTQTRLASIRDFSRKAKEDDPSHSPSSSILLCTSVASRGLDLPLVGAVVQYDLPTEGGATEYVHRVGRTARAGKGGEAWSMVTPSEQAWVSWVEGKMRGKAKKDDKEALSIGLTGVSVETVLQSGYGGKDKEYEERATDVQLSFERWVLRKPENAHFARKAFLSHMRAYATHPSDEKHIFHIRHLHIGHLAKAFALREAPKAVTGSNKKPSSRPGKTSKEIKDGESGADPKSTEKRMQTVVRAQGKLTKKGGMIMSSGSSEFQIAGGSALEKLVSLK